MNKPIVLENVSKTFKDPVSGENINILDIDTMIIEKGNHTAITGFSGSGKTTLLHIIAGLIHPDKGSVRILDKDIFSMSEEKRDRFRGENIGIVYQSFNLLEPFNIIDNIRLGLQFARKIYKKEKILSLMEHVGLQHRLHHKPYQLSQGERQRVAIVRALAPEPPILLADEPSGNLDPDTRDETIEIMFRLSSKTNTTIVLVTHDREVSGRFNTNFDISKSSGVLK